VRKGDGHKTQPTPCLWKGYRTNGVRIQGLLNNGVPLLQRLEAGRKKGEEPRRLYRQLLRVKQGRSPTKPDYNEKKRMLDKSIYTTRYGKDRDIGTIKKGLGDLAKATLSESLKGKREDPCRKEGKGGRK